MRALILAFATLTLAGCASTVHKADSGAPTPVGTTGGVAGKTVILNITGSTVSTTAKDWNDFKALWPERCTPEATAVGAAFSMQDGQPAPTGVDGTLVVVDVDDDRYVSTGARVAFGIMTGNAYIKAHVTFRDLK